MRNALKKPANSAAYTLNQFDPKRKEVRHTKMRIVSICSSHSFSRSRSMTSIPARVLVLDTVPRYGCIHAFNVVLPGSHVRLECF